MCVQALVPTDYPSRFRFGEWLLQIPDLLVLVRVTVTDEAMFLG